MPAEVKLDIVIPLSHHVELSLPETLPPGPAEVIVRTASRPLRDRRSQAMGMDEGKGRVAEDFDAPLPDDLQRLFEGRS
jgi:hypothetical protein